MSDKNEYLCIFIIISNYYRYVYYSICVYLILIMPSAGQRKYNNIILRW